MCGDDVGLGFGSVDWREELEVGGESGELGFAIWYVGRGF